MRDPRREAAARLGDRYDVRVLEPSPPAVHEPPYFADDPAAGGEVVPVERAGCRTWADVCDESGDAELGAWCEDRWLVRKQLAPLPSTFAATRVALHRLAEHVIAPRRHLVDSQIDLRYTHRGFGTPFFGDDWQIRVEDGVLLFGDGAAGDGAAGDGAAGEGAAGERAVRPATLRQACAHVGLPVGTPTVYPPATSADPDSPLDVDPASARALGDWYGFCTSLLEQLRAEATDEDAVTRPQLWPEHFDIAIVLGPEGRRANVGGSPGDELHDEPYLYVGPFEPRQGDFWNEPFGASLSYSAILAGADPLEFLRHGKDLVQR